MTTVNDLDLSAPLAFVAGCADPYPALCVVIAGLLESVKMPIDEKHDVLGDVADILDKVQPSTRSGYVLKRKPRK